MSETLNEDYWTQRYQEGRTGWDLGEASRPLIEYCKQLPSKDLKILIPGAGLGYEAQALWEAGFKNVHVIDLSADPLDKLKSRVPGFPEKQLIQGDFFELEQTFDLVLEQTFFCALDPSMRSSYASHMSHILQPGGVLAGVWFVFPLTEQGPPFGGSPEEYRQHLSPAFDIVTLEPCYNSMPGREGKEVFIRAERKKNPA